MDPNLSLQIVEELLSIVIFGIVTSALHRSCEVRTGPCLSLCGTATATVAVAVAATAATTPTGLVGRTYIIAITSTAITTGTHRRRHYHRCCRCHQTRPRSPHDPPT